MPTGPMLLTAGPPQTGREWINEIKLDGARALARVAGGQVDLQSRPGNSFTGRFPEVTAALTARLDGHTAILDGELVALDTDGMPHFGLLQRRLAAHKPTAVHQRAIPGRLWLFDLLHLDGQDLTGLPYRTRRAILEDLLPGQSGTVAVAPAWSDIDGPALAEIAAELGVEGTCSKRADSLYHPGRRTKSWIKSPLRRRHTVWLAGYFPGRTAPVGALLLAGHDAESGGLRYAGSVSAGLGSRISRVLYEALRPHHTAAAPWSTRPDDDRAASPVVWLRPGCTAEVEFREFTAAGRFRHVAFKGLVPADEVTQQWVPLPSRRTPGS